MSFGGPIIAKTVEKLVMWSLIFLVCSPSASGQCLKVPSGFTGDTQDFELSNGGWTTGGNASDWAWGTPNKTIIKYAASGSKAWMIGGVNGNSYNDGESSWIQSPCYDFSNLKYPAVGFYVYWETEYSYDGTLLQYSTDNGVTWKDVGSYSDPVNCLNQNWYNTPGVRYLGGRNGWSGSTAGNCGTGNGSRGWVLASHTMPYLAGAPSVRFRFVFGAGTSCNAYNGFAFDYFTVGEALPNRAAFNFNCTSGTTVNFSSTSWLCPKLSWDFGDPASGPNNTSSSLVPSHTFSGPGQYTVSLTASGPDNAPSTVTKIVTILEAKTQVLSEPLCNGDKNGSAIVNVTPAVAGLNYSWNTSPVQSSPTAVDLGAGTYTVTVSAAGACTAQGSVTISEPALLSNSIASNDPTCAGNDGQVTLTTNGGTAPYAYNWSPNVSSSNSASGLSGGSYKVVVTDKNNCTKTVNVSLTNPSSIVASVSTKKDVSCNGGKDGSATITASGGSGSLTYSWSPSGGNGQTATNLAAGNYTVTVKDASGCSMDVPVVIGEPSLIDITITAQDATCGNANGSAAATVTGGTAPYSYAWSPGGLSTPAITNLTAGTYSLTVTDKNNCKQNATATIAGASGLNLSTTHSDVKCFGANDGSASVNVTGGIQPYTINWSNGATTASITGLAGGTYTVTVKDASGCSNTSSVTINEPSGKSSIVLAVTDALCANGTGSIKATVSGGTAPYQYAWTPGNITTPDLTNVSAGNYTLTLTDNNGCKTSANGTIKEPAAITVSISAQDAGCGKANGSATATVTGGTAPYSYAWSPGGLSTPAINNLTAGTYSLTVTDKNNCRQNATVTIAGTSGINLSTTHNDVKCFGANDGSASVNVTGGIQPYTISWSNGATTAAIAGLSGGTYTVTVKDASGCSNTGSVTINEPSSQSSIVLAVADALCTNGTGNIKATVSGGTAPYQYAWTPGNITTSDLTNVSAGNYTLTVTDNNGCKTSANGTIKEPAAIAVNVSTQDATCGSANGVAKANVTGGTPPYTYNWSPGNIGTATITNLAAGKYNLTVTDKNGCRQNGVADIVSSSAVRLNLTATDITCNGANDGIAMLTTSGGVQPYKIQWSNGSNDVNSLSGLSKGRYDVTVTDQVGCISTAYVTVAEPDALAIVLNTTNALCSGGNGSITAQVTGGTLPYNYQWNINNANNPTVSGGAGKYDLLVTDKSGCVASTSGNIIEPSVITINFNIVDPSCGNNNGSISAVVAGGTAPYVYKWKNSNNNSATLGSLAPGTYSLTVIDKNGCSKTADAIVKSSGSLAVDLSSVDVTCSGLSNGSARLSISGGTPGYTVAWSSGQSTNIITNLAKGTYTATVTDAGGCISKQTVSITEPAKLNVVLTSQMATCETNDGSVASQVSGGVAPYRFTWKENNLTTPDLSNVPWGRYTATVTDANGCKETQSTLVTSVNPLKVDLGKDTAICGNVAIPLNAGVPAGSYRWQDGSTGSSFMATNAGRYWVSVKDIRGCVASDTINITKSLNCTDGVWFANAFTPNGDGKNELFGPLGNLSAVKDFTLMIFNRWGQKVFESKNPSIKWDGRFKNEFLPGTYAWFSVYKIGNQEVSQKGTVVLIK